MVGLLVKSKSAPIIKRRQSGFVRIEDIVYAFGDKGINVWAVRPLKRYVSWVQTVVRQVGLYPLWAQETCGRLPLVREDRGGRTAGGSVVVPTAWLSSYVRSR